MAGVAEAVRGDGTDASLKDNSHSTIQRDNGEKKEARGAEAVGFCEARAWPACFLVMKEKEKEKEKGESGFNVIVIVIQRQAVP